MTRPVLAPFDETCAMATRWNAPNAAMIGRFTQAGQTPRPTPATWCGHHIHPMVGTHLCQDSHMPLTKWFYAIYLFTTTRHGVPAKELQRQLGVSYPTAFRMAHLKSASTWPMIDGDPALGGHVEADETVYRRQAVRAFRVSRSKRSKQGGGVRDAGTRRGRYDPRGAGCFGQDARWPHSQECGNGQHD